MSLYPTHNVSGKQLRDRFKISNTQLDLLMIWLEVFLTTHVFRLKTSGRAFNFKNSGLNISRYPAECFYFETGVFTIGFEICSLYLMVPIFLFCITKNCMCFFNALVIKISCVFYGAKMASILSLFLPLLVKLVGRRCLSLTKNSSKFK